MKIASWVGSLAATLVVSLPFTTAAGCADTRASVNSGGKIVVPFAPDIEWGFQAAVGGGTEMVGDGGIAAAKKCFLLTFYDKDLVVLERVVIEADAMGTFVKKLPAGADSFLAVLIDCDKAEEIQKQEGVPPKPEEERDEPEEEREEQPPVDEPAVGPMKPSAMASGSSASTPTWTEFTFHGGTIHLDIAYGGTNVRFAATVLASDVGDAFSMLEPIMERGIGAGLSPLVNVHVYTHASLDLMGVRIRVASTTQIEELFLDVNHGAHVADLGARLEVVSSNVNAWSVVESTMPLGDVVVSTLPWEEFLNQGSVDIRLAGIHEFVHADITTTVVPRR